MLKALKAEQGRRAALDVIEKIEREILEQKCADSSRKTRFWDGEVPRSSRALVGVAHLFRMKRSKTV
jgi:hypothetical protein